MVSARQRQHGGCVHAFCFRYYNTQQRVVVADPVQPSLTIRYLPSCVPGRQAYWAYLAPFERTNSQVAAPVIRLENALMRSRWLWAVARVGGRGLVMRVQGMVDHD